MKAAIFILVLGTFFLSLEASADPNVQPFQDKEWQKAKCRFHVLAPDGAYGNHETASVEGCVNSAEVGLMIMGNSASDESPLHEPAEVEFIDGAGAKHVCQVKSKKDKYDRFEDRFKSQVNQPGFYDSIDPALKGLLDENFEVFCQTPTT